MVAQLKSKVVVISLLLLGTAECFAQVPQNNVPMQQKPRSVITVPAGTRVALGLVRPISIKKAKQGVPVYLQVTFPVTVGPQVVIPAGSYVQGTIEKVVKRDRTKQVMEFQMHSASVIFSTGYTVMLGSSVDVAPTNARLMSPAPPVSGGSVPVSAAVGGPAPPALPQFPSMGNGARNAIIALGVAGTAATVALAIVHYRHDDVRMEAGTPVEIVLQSPLLLDQERVQAAVQQYSAQLAGAPPQIVQPPQKPKLCYNPGTPSSPDVVVPGSPDVIIPGTRGSPGVYYPCPK